MTFVQRKNGEMIDLDSLGIRTRDFIVSSPAPLHNFEDEAMGYGQIDLGSSLGPRDITCLFRLTATDYIDFGYLRDEVFNLFRGDEAFYLIEKRNPGKRWLVKNKSPFTIPQTFVYGNFEVEFIAPSGLAESLGTSLNPFEWDVDLWQWNMGIPFDDGYSYEHTSNNFMIYNAGTETVNPRSPHMKLRIEIQATAPSYLELINQTTDDLYRYDGFLTTGDTLVLDGIRSTRNSLSVFRDTNGKLITLAPGENRFEVRGAQLGRILFDFPFYYV